MRAESFYAFGATLGLSESGMEELLNGGEPPQVEDAGNGFALVRIPPRQTTPGCEGVATQVKAKILNKWMKELNRLRNEEQK